MAETRSRPSRGGERRPPRPADTGAPSSSAVTELPPRELVVVARPEAGLRARREGVASVAGADVQPLADILAEAGATLRPLFGVSEERLRFAAAEAASTSDVQLPDLSVFYRVEAPEDRLDDLVVRLREEENVEAAYLKPPAEPAQWLNDMVPAFDEAPPATPDFTSRQGYLDAAPGGIDARFAWTRPGGSGADVRIIDIEGAWRFTHEDLTQNQGGVMGGTPSTDIRWRNHGTAVIGEFGGDRNSIGVTGICPDANVRAFSIFGSSSSSQAIRGAADALRPGDIILIELHRPGPRFNFQNRDDQRGYIAIEWWPDDLAAIQYAVGRGVIVVEAAGNGAENLDDALYDTPGAGFPTSWRNPFRRNPVDSGAIVVGAGAPPSGNFGPDRCRLDFSNFGALIDAQGWGREVVTTGYGDLQGGTNEDLWYTARFSGTSSASPIVVGALGCVQGVQRAAGLAPKTPAEARALLRATGSPQQDGPSGPRTQRIGNRPNLRQLLPAKPKDTKEKELKEVKEVKEIKEKDLKEKELTKELKDRKEKDRKEIKEKDRKEFKEIKELKEKELKEFKEFKERKELEKGPKELEGLPSAGGSLEERVGHIEEALDRLTHFIGAELRPDLETSALAGEEGGRSELDELARMLEKQAADAKQAKDNKDIEKLRER